MDYVLVPNLLTEKAIPEKGIVKHTLHDDASLRMILFAFAAGEELAVHSAPAPATMVFLEGEATVGLGDDRKELAAGALVHMEAKLPHSIVSKTPVRMLLSIHKSAKAS